MIHVADAAVGPVCVEFAVVAHLFAEFGGALHAGGAFPEFIGLSIEVFASDSVAVHCFSKGHAVDTFHFGVYESGIGENLHDREDASGAVHVLDVVVGVGCHFAEHRGLARERVDVIHREVGACFMGHGEQMEHCVCRAAHRYVEGHGVEHGLAYGYIAWEHTGVAVAVVGICVAHYHLGRFLEQLQAVDVSGHYGSVAGEGEADCFVERVHGVGGEHSGA